MYLRPLDRLPEKGWRQSSRSNNKIKTMLFEFYESDSDFAEVVFMKGEYSSSSSLYSGIKKALESPSFRDLSIAVDFIQGGVYLRREE